MVCGRLSCLSLAVETDLAWQEGHQGHMAEVVDMDLDALSILIIIINSLSSSLVLIKQLTSAPQDSTFWGTIGNKTAQVSRLC